MHGGVARQFGDGFEQNRRDFELGHRLRFALHHLTHLIFFGFGQRPTNFLFQRRELFGFELRAHLLDFLVRHRHLVASALRIEVEVGTETSRHGFGQ